nr:ribosomal protein L7Ae/L30e/S12e/Gadd45 [Tanacetum cinerariifolium]
MLNNQKSPICKIGLGFDSGKASTSETKTMSFVGSSAKKVMNGSTIKVHGSTLLGSVCLRTCLELDEWIKDSGCSKHMTSNKSFFSTYKAYDRGNVVFGSNLKGKIIGKGICIYYDAWGLDELEKTFDQIEPYNSRLPTLDDIQNLIHRKIVHEKIDKEGNTIHEFPNQIKTNELFDHLRPYELVTRENVYSAIGNRDHTKAVIELMFYCLENRQPFHLAYFIIMRMYFFRDRRDKVLPYGMILTRLFKNLKANMAQGSFDERYKLFPRKRSPLKAKQPKKPPPKRTRNVGKSKRTQLSTSSSTKTPPSHNGDFPSIKLFPR